MYKISHLFANMSKILPVILRFGSKLSKHVRLRENRQAYTNLREKIKVLRKSTKISGLEIVHKNALSHIGDTFCLFLRKPSANVDIYNFVRKFIANNFAKKKHYIFARDSRGKCGNGF